MNYEILVPKLIDKARRNNDVEMLTEAFELVRETETDGATKLESETYYIQGNFDFAHDQAKKIRQLSAQMVKSGGGQKALDLNKRSLLFDARWNFDCYLRYIEFNQPFERQFYNPRRHYLRPVVEAYQEVLDGKLDFLSVSLTKRAGKSQLGINFVNLISGRHPNNSSLMEGQGDDLVNSFYKGCLEYLQNDEYLYYDIFPECKLVATKADKKIINLNDNTRFPTVMCRSIEAAQIGLSEATNVLYLDDCVNGREEAKNRYLMDKKWEVISGDIVGRALEGTPIIACGTRYSIYDPIGRLQEEAVAQDWRWKAIEIPALNEKGESNYEYYNPKIKRRIFTTKFFLHQKDMLTEEQWESEFQQKPFEAKGLLFPAEKLNRYFRLPECDPDAIIAVCDTAEGKGDSTMMPVAYVYGQDVYIVDAVFNNAPPEITKPMCANMLVNHSVSRATFESNGAGGYFCRDVEKLVTEQGGMCSFRTKYQTKEKHTRIEMASDNILKHFLFKDESLYKHNDMYGQMMYELCQYTRTGKVPHDDAPDGLALLEAELRKAQKPQIRVSQRFF